MPGITGLTQTAVADVFTGAPEPGLESKWHQPFSEPVRQKIAPQLAVALIASGLAYVGAAPFAEAVTEDRWHQPWSEPVRTRFMPPAHQQARAPDLLPPFAETVTEGRWHQPFSEPVRRRPRLLEALHQNLAFAPPFSAGAVQSEWSGPAPSLVRFQYQAQARPPWPDINVAWLPPLAEPARIRPPVIIPAPEQQFQPFDEDIIFADRWFAWWSEPVRLKPALGTGNQHAPAFGPQPFPFVPGSGGWYEPDEPRPRVRKPGAPREITPKIAPPSFADVLGNQLPTRLADVFGSGFAKQLAELRPPAPDLYMGEPVPASARQAAPPGVIDAIADEIDARDAIEAVHALEQLEHHEREALIAAVLAHFAKGA
jgi:hypothetical protein